MATYTTCDGRSLESLDCDQCAIVTDTHQQSVSGIKLALVQAKVLASREARVITMGSGSTPSLLKPSSPKLFSFGVATDIQYADIPDGQSYHGVPRFYRNSIVGLRRAVESWQGEGADFAVHLGDILDGFQRKNGGSDEALQIILDCFDQLQRKVYHMLGNHCLYNLPRSVLNSRLGIPEQPDGSSYYSFCPAIQYRFIVLDAYDVSMLGWPQGHPKHEMATAIIRANNPNTENPDNADGMGGVARRFVRYGGGCGEEQLLWLKEQLKAAEAESQNVLLFGHIPFFPGTSPPTCLLWNYQEVLQLLWSTPPGMVVATMAGHTHQNGHLVDTHGIHHLVLPSLLETPPGRDAFGCVDVHPDTFILRGRDCMMSIAIPVTRPASAKATST